VERGEAALELDAAGAAAGAMSGLNAETGANSTSIHSSECQSAIE
jgi:hypothetical protein